MKNLSLSFCFLILCFTGFSQKSGHFGAPKYAPADGKKMLIIGQDLGAVGGLPNYTDGYIDNVAAGFPAGVTSYSNTDLGGLQSFANWGAGDINANEYVESSDFSNTFIVIGLYLVNQLNAVKNGQHDTKLKIFANWVKNQDRPVLIRIGYEFEGPWNNYNATQFKDAWKHIVHLFDDEGVKNVAYVWQSAGLNYSNISAWYPGDEYVNWVGYSHFDNPNPGQSIRDFAAQHNKPIMIAEATPRIDLKNGNGESHWNNWFEPLFESIYQNDQIKALAYINVNWDVQSLWNGQGWGDSRVQVSPFILNAWINELQKEPWLAGDENLFETLGHDSWLTSSVKEISVDQPEIQITTDQKLLSIASLEQEMNGVKIFDTKGNLIYNTTATDYQYQIELGQISSGLFIVVCKIGNQDISKKVFIANK